MNRLEDLYKKYLDGSISDEEKKELFSKIKASDDEELQHLADGFLNSEAPQDLNHLQGKTDLLLSGIKERIAEQKPKSGKLWIKVVATVAALLILTLVVYYYNAKDLVVKQPVVQVINDLAPGQKRATLTLADGKVVILDSAYGGQLAEVDGIRISKTSDGQLVYENNGEGTTNQINTISIPRGGEYQLLLPDGTRVWLNAATTLQYPTRFTGNEREVKLTGEAYFEVAKDPERPFRVKTETQTIQVLGTHFNVNNYRDKGQTITTLAEGAVKVITSTGTKLLKPGQQTVVDAGSIKLQDADLEIALAWKNGLLFFKDAPLQTVLDEVSRWYDVDISYRGAIPDKVLSGGVSRTANLSAMLRILKLTGVKASLISEGDTKKLIIEP